MFNFIKRKKANIALIIALMVGYSLSYMDKNMISTAIISLSLEFHLTTIESGFLMSIFFLGYTFMQLPGGWISDKIGSKKVLIFSMLFVSICSFLFSSINLIILLLLTRLLSGIFHGVYPASCSQAVSSNFVEKRRTMVQSFIMMTTGIGGFLAFAIGALLITINWRYAYILLGSLFFVAACLIYFFVPEKVSEKKEINISLKKIITDQRVIILFFVNLLINITYYGVMSWLPSYLKQTFELTIKQTGNILIVNSVCQIVGCFLTGILLNKIFRHHEKLFIFIAGTISVLSTVALIFNHLNLTISIIIVGIIGLSTISVYTSVFAWPQKLFKTDEIGRSFGFINTGGAIGAFLSPALLGWIISITKKAHTQYTYAFIFIAVATAASIITALFLRHNKYED